MKNNIVIAGDSFCASQDGWPAHLANLLNLNLICHGVGGQSWWNAREFVDSLDESTIEKTEVMVFVHTNSDRIPTHNTQLGLIDHSAEPVTEIQKAIHLYYKFIHEPSFLKWAQQQWFSEISQRWGHKKLVHLHSFPWSVVDSDLLTGLNITTNLCSLSLNELGAQTFSLFNDHRANHLNTHNNTVLAQQLKELLEKFQNKQVELNASEFDLKTLKWFDWN